MITLTDYSSSSKLGKIHKKNSDLIMEKTFENDINTRIAYFYDYYHDKEPLKYYGLNPEGLRYGVPIEIKFMSNAFNRENADQVGYHIQFKPSFRWENERKLEYYNTNFVKKWESEFPIGMYLAIPDEKGVYRKWLCTETANWLSTQFPTWYVLPIDHVFQWIYDNKKYQMCGVSRSQSSYNSGLWVRV